jgi:hypothetical protein
MKTHLGEQKLERGSRVKRIHDKNGIKNKQKQWKCNSDSWMAVPRDMSWPPPHTQKTVILKLRFFYVCVWKKVWRLQKQNTSKLCKEEVRRSYVQYELQADSRSSFVCATLERLQYFLYRIVDHKGGEIHRPDEMHCPPLCGNYSRVHLSARRCHTEDRNTGAICRKVHDSPLPNPSTFHYISPMQATTKNKFWEELIAYFPLIRNGPHKRRRLHQFFAFVGTCQHNRCLATTWEYTDG